MLMEALELQKSETQKFREEMTHRAQEAISAADERVEIAEWKAEEIVQKNLQETSKIQKEFLAAMERFRNNPDHHTTRKTLANHHPHEHESSPGPSAINDNNVDMSNLTSSNPTLPDSSDTEPSNESEKEGDEIEKVSDFIVLRFLQ
jgi:hypothetical protein